MTNFMTKKSKRINTKNTEKIENAIALGNSRAKARLIELSEIFSAIVRAEKYFSDNDIPKKYQKGVKISNNVAVCNSYRNKAEYTFFGLEKGSKYWFLTDCYRENCSHCSYGKNSLILTKTEILLKFERARIQENIEI